MTIVRRTVEITQIHVIHETLDTVVVEIHGAVILTRAGIAGILIGTLGAILGAIHVTRESRVVRVNRKIVDRMLVITELREVRVGMTDARHTVIVALVVTTEDLVGMTGVRGEMIEARVEMTVDRAETTVVRAEMTEALVEMTVARVEMTGVHDEMIENRAETTVARVEMTEALGEMIEARVGMTEAFDEVIHVDEVTARDVVAPMILAGTTEVRE